MPAPETGAKKKSPSAHTTSRKYNRRYFITCANKDCKKRKRVTYKDAKYCSHKCRQKAYREHKAEAEAKARAEAAAQAERLAKWQAERAEQARRAASEKEFRERMGVQEAIRRETEERQLREQEAKVARFVPACPKCGKRKWTLSSHRTFLGIRREMYCEHCATNIKPSFIPEGCCSPLSLETYWYTLNAQGELHCHSCNQVKAWGEWKVRKE